MKWMTNQLIYLSYYTGHLLKNNYRSDYNRLTIGGTEQSN